MLRHFLSSVALLVMVCPSYGTHCLGEPVASFCYGVRTVWGPTAAPTPSTAPTAAPTTSWVCPFGTGEISNPSGQFEQRVYAANGSGVLSTSSECAKRAKLEHPAATGVSFAIEGYFAGECWAEFGTVRATQYTDYISCLYADRPSVSPTTSGPSQQPGPTDSPTPSPTPGPTESPTLSPYTTLCGVNEYVSNFVCTDCPAGYENAAGDDPSAVTVNPTTNGDIDGEAATGLAVRYRCRQTEPRSRSARLTTAAPGATQATSGYTN